MIHKLNIFLFSAIILTGTIGFFIFSKKQISEDEKRKLATIPQFNWNTYIYGEFTDSIDAYVDDHFVFRNQMISSADFIRSLKGIKLKEKAKIVKVIKPKTLGNPNNVQGSDSRNTTVQGIDGEYTGDLLILEGKVYNLTGGSPVMSAAYAKMVNEYAQKLQGECRVFSAVAPLACAFIKDPKYKMYHGQNRRTLAAIGANLKNGAIFSDVFSELDAHSDKDLFFGSDHHWNATGAYYAYSAFCKSAGLGTVPLSAMTKKTKYGFLGSLYQLTRDDDVKNRPDTFEYYIPGVSTKGVRFNESDFNIAGKISTFANASGGNMYSTFISGDFPLSKITTSVKNGKKCIVVKNSMGNAFSVYLISHYEEVWIVDLRYSKHNILSIIRENKINDMIFAVGMYAAMSHGTIGMMRRLATHPAQAPKLPNLPETPIRDSISNAALPKKDSI